MRKVSALIITFIFLFNTMGYYFVFSYEQYLVRSEMRRFIKTGYFKDSYIVLKIVSPFSNPDFKRIDKGEFKFRDKLYDIVSEKQEYNYTIFLCINDKNEEKLLAGFHHYFELAIVRNNPGKTRHALALAYHVIKLALIKNSWNQPPVLSKEISFINRDPLLFSIFRPPISPPPKSA